MAELSRYEQALVEFAQTRADQGQSWTDEEAIAFQEELLHLLNAQLSPEQVEQLHENMAEAEQAIAEWEFTEEECEAAIADLNQQLFEQRFEDIGLTPEEEQFARAEVTRYYQTFGNLIASKEAEGECTFYVTKAEVQALEDEFFSRLEEGLSAKQVHQVRNNKERVEYDIKSELNQSD